MYLVFILFLFLTSPGAYVAHFNELRKTQQVLNADLFAAFASLVPETPQELATYQLLQRSLGSLDSIQAVAKQTIGEEALRGERQKESQFANKALLKGALGQALATNLSDFQSAFLRINGRDLSDKLLQHEDFSGQKLESLNFFFKDCPNAVVLTLFEHFRTVMLLEGMQVFRQESPLLAPLAISRQDSVRGLSLFSEHLLLGQIFKLELQHGAQDLAVWVDGAPLRPVLADSTRMRYEYQPLRTGLHQVDFVSGGQAYRRFFRVSRPGLGFKLGGVALNARLGIRDSLRLNLAAYQDQPLRFESEQAELDLVGDQLVFTPFAKGLISLRLHSDTGALDSLQVYVHEAPRLQVELQDVAGEVAAWQEAIRLESTNPFWRVLSYRVRIYRPDAHQSQGYGSQTRLLASAVKEEFRAAPAGSHLYFDQIKLISRRGSQEREAKPIIIRK